MDVHVQSLWLLPLSFDIQHRVFADSLGLCFEDIEGAECPGFIKAIFFVSCV
jgi:hypothetical protein